MGDSMISPPKAVTDMATKTELAVLEVVAITPCDLKGLRKPFREKLKALKAVSPVYDRFSHSLDEFVSWMIKMEWIDRDILGRLTLTHDGKLQLRRLRGLVKKMYLTRRIR